MLSKYNSKCFLKTIHYKLTDDQINGHSKSGYLLLTDKLFPLDKFLFISKMPAH